jgi:hydrogenase 3 maturation protease
VTPSLRTALQKPLSVAAPRIAVLAIGSTLRGDDAAGMLAGRKLSERLSKTSTPSQDHPALAVFLGETAPENLTGRIKEFLPTCLIILDAVDTGAEPGSICLIDPAQVDPGAGMSTHSTSIKLLTDYLRQFISCEVLIIGIQPQTLEFDSPPSKPVMEAAESVAGTIADTVVGR